MNTPTNDEVTASRRQLLLVGLFLRCCNGTTCEVANLLQILHEPEVKKRLSAKVKRAADQVTQFMELERTIGPKIVGDLDAFMQAYATNEDVKKTMDELMLGKMENN